MRGILLRGGLVLCASVFLIGALTGCPGKKQATVIDEPPPVEPAPPPAPPPTPPAPPTVDPNAWKGQIQDVYFDFDKYDLRADARALLQENARLMKENPGASVTLEGHCDERGTEQYNLALGQRRADAVRAYLSDLGVDSALLKTVSYGEEKPFSMAHTEDAWSQNRRVHFDIR